MSVLAPDEEHLRRSPALRRQLGPRPQTCCHSQANSCVASHTSQAPGGSRSARARRRDRPVPSRHSAGIQSAAAYMMPAISTNRPSGAGFGSASLIGNQSLRAMGCQHRGDDVDFLVCGGLGRRATHCPDVASASSGPGCEVSLPARRRRLLRKRAIGSARRCSMSAKLSSIRIIAPPSGVSIAGRTVRTATVMAHRFPCRTDGPASAAGPARLESRFRGLRCVPG